MTVVVGIEVGQSKAQKIAALRRAMAAQSAQFSGVSGGSAGIVGGAFNTASSSTGGTRGAAAGAAGAAGTAVDVEKYGISESLPVPAGLERVLGGVVRRGAVSVIENPGAVLAALIAETTKIGYVALVGVGEQGLLSVVEQGGRLANIICVPNPGIQPLEVIALLAEGVDLVVTSLERAPTPSKARPLQARLRNCGCALVSVGQQWPGAAVKISSSVVGVDGLGFGSGRIRAVDYQVAASATRFSRRHGLWRVSALASAMHSGGSIGEAVDNVVAFPSERRVG